MARGRQVVPECHKALDAWEYEIAAELGLPVGKQSPAALNVKFATELGAVPAGSVREDYWGHISARDAGAVGGQNHASADSARRAIPVFVISSPRILG